ncbi:E3 ubiquitin-protein ligase PRT6 [Hordeum vulgare]|nr:E3 ubiquitin-protein ligase PRT6 [Hordeum vulgare]
MAEEAPGAGPAAVPISLSPLLPPPQMVVVALDATRDHREVEVRMSLRALIARGDILRGGDSLLVLGILHSVTNPKTLRYSVVSIEIASCDRMSSYSAQSKSCLESLRSELNSSSGLLLSLLFRVSHSARVLNRREVLLRFEGIQLLAGSISSGISGDKDLLDATKRKGTSLPMVDPESEGEIFPDIQFWKQCADPVLAQDPFSSLMSALFCLPIEVLTSTKFFIPIVHLFYIVCVIQALITCYGQEAFDRSIFRGCLLNDVCQEMSGYDIAR